MPRSPPSTGAQMFLLMTPTPVSSIWPLIAASTLVHQMPATLSTPPVLIQRMVPRSAFRRKKLTTYSYQYSAQDGGWNIGYAADPASPWLHKASDWVPIFLHYIQETWKPSGGIAVSEFGFAEPFEQLKQLRTDIQFDYARSGYYHDYMQAILLAMSEGVNVVGCLAWSILDNLEWSDGYTVKFGMQVCHEF